MKSATDRFNIYFVIACLLCGCQAGKSVLKKEASTIRFHLEVNPDGTDKNAPVRVNRAQPFYVNAENASFLTEHNVVRAAVADDGLGGYEISIHFDRPGTWLLEQYTAANKGKRIVIFSHFGRPKEAGKGEMRCLGAPVIVQRIADGAFTFTPDASREEAERIVRGLNNIAKAKQKFNP